MACEQCDGIADEAVMRESYLAETLSERDDRIKELEKALDDVQGWINAAKDDLDDASKIIGRMV